MKKNCPSTPSLFMSIGILIATTNSYAGFHNFTMHSRANCAGFNESISWHFRHNNTLHTQSLHSSTNPKNWWKCDINTGWENTWRSAAYHFAEGFPGGEWTVTGYHYGLAPDKRTAILLSITTATDCNIYDGWWDQ